MNTLKYTEHIASEITRITGIPCFCDTNIEAFTGERNDVFILAMTSKEDVLALNNTHRLSYTLSYVVQPETQSSEETLANIDDCYHKVLRYFRELPRYTDTDGAVFLQVEDEQLMTVPDGSKQTFSWLFCLVVHFDY